VPRRVFARHLLPGQLGPKRVWTPMRTLPLTNVIIPTALIIDLYPISFGDLSYSLWVVGEEVPRLGTFFEDFLVGVEDRYSEFV
jgi:hypothetical protein